MSDWKLVLEWDYLYSFKRLDVQIKYKLLFCKYLIKIWFGYGIWKTWLAMLRLQDLNIELVFATGSCKLMNWKCWQVVNDLIHCYFLAVICSTFFFPGSLVVFLGQIIFSSYKFSCKAEMWNILLWSCLYQFCHTQIQEHVCKDEFSCMYD